MTDEAKLSTFEVQFADVALTLQIKGSCVQVSESDYKILVLQDDRFVAPRSRILYIKKLIEDDVVPSED